MGALIGKINNQEAKYKVIYKDWYEIREYEPYYIAEIETNRKDQNDGFLKLAKYIGLIGTAENEQKQKIDMMSPVQIYNQCDQQMGKSELTQKNQNYDKTNISFILPYEHNTFPAPNNKEIKIKYIPRQFVAVDQFNGGWGEKKCIKHVKVLLNHLIDFGLFQSDESINSINWQISYYNPPFCISSFKRNEVWIQIDENKLNQRLQIE